MGTRVPRSELDTRLSFALDSLAMYATPTKHNYVTVSVELRTRIQNAAVFLQNREQNRSPPACNAASIQHCEKYVSALTSGRTTYKNDQGLDHGNDHTFSGAPSCARLSIRGQVLEVIGGNFTVRKFLQFPDRRPIGAALSAPNATDRDPRYVNGGADLFV